MAKTVPASKRQEWKGLDRITQVVHEMGCIFRELSKDDVGIDGEIEIVAAKAAGAGFEATGGIVKVQAKSGSSYVKQDSSTGFVTPVNKNDLEYWNKTTFPVLFIVYHPDDDQLYWKEMHAYLRDAQNIWSAPLYVAFDKADDQFSLDSYERIREIAQGSPPRVSLREQERLFSNLLPITRMPRIITYAATRFRDYEDFNWIRRQIEGSSPPFRLLDGRLYTLTDLRNAQNPLRVFCDTGSISDLAANQWLEDEARKRDFVSLLNQLLGIHMRSCGLWYNPHFHRNYFPRLDETTTSFPMRWTNLRSGWEGPRTVVKLYTYGGRSFWRHTAVNVTFRQIGSGWFLQILPKYFFTEDGETPYDSDLVGSLTTRVKAMERNSHVLNHVLFWADVLSNGNTKIEMNIGPRPLVIADKTPATAIADFAIPYDPATFDVPVEEVDVQLGLFESVDVDDEDNDDYWG